MSLNQVTLSLDIYDGAGDLIQAGQALFTPSIPLVDGTDHLYIWQRPVTVSLVPPAGASDSWLPTVTLYATDSTNLSPSGWAWQVSFQAPGAPAGYSFFLDYSNGADQYLDDLSPAVSVTTLQSYLTLPSGSPVAGQVPAVIASGSPATRWTTLVSLGSQQPADQNLVAWAYDPAIVTNDSSPTSGVVQLVRVILRSAQTVTNVLAHVEAGGTGLVTARNYAGLYSAAGTLLSATADQTTAWASAGLQTMALATQQVGLAAGIYYVALLSNESAGATPAFGRNNGIASASSMLNAGLTVATARFATGPTGQNTLPGTITMSGLSFASVAYWAAAS